ncbi:hypothetical protein M8C21_002155 [Ambrosia artemisiifolia]|uniref:Uncharacterized protein n=1 Tax=Ambrosia artemisiifolia TaxID=4212 RepID=A0AAD5BPB3_AMBAR|nr:hypothetical protein M8C21_002155 [Ambrosia artemisiifolia]
MNKYIIYLKLEVAPHKNGSPNLNSVHFPSPHYVYFWKTKVSKLNSVNLFYLVKSQILNL